MTWLTDGKISSWHWESTRYQHVNPFTPKWSTSNFPCSLTRNIHITQCEELGFSLGEFLNSAVKIRRMNLTNITSTPVLNESLGQRCFGGDSITVRALRVTAYGVIILASLVGNSLVILSVVRYKKLRTTTNIFIANMAAADLLITIIVYMPRPLVMYVNGVTWFTGTSGYVLCKIVPFLHSLAILVSILTLLLISIERLCAFLGPLSYTCDLKTSRKTASFAGVWIVASLARVPYVLALRTRVHSSGRTYCSSKLKNLFGTEKARDIYYTSLLVAFYALPLIFIFISYIVIIARLRKTNNRRANKNTQNISSK